MKKYFGYKAILCLLAFFLFYGDALFAKKIVTKKKEPKKTERVIAKGVPIRVGDQFSLKNKKWDKYIARDTITNRIIYVDSWRDYPGAVFTSEYVSSDQNLLITQEPVFIKFLAQKNLVLGSGWRELISSESSDENAQWIFSKVGDEEESSADVYDGDEVLVQNKLKPTQYLFSYFAQFPVHDSIKFKDKMLTMPADDQFIYIIEKNVKEAAKEPEFVKKGPRIMPIEKVRKESLSPLPARKVQKITSEKLEEREEEKTKEESIVPQKRISRRISELEEKEEEMWQPEPELQTQEESFEEQSAYAEPKIEPKKAKKTITRTTRERAVRRFVEPVN
ncbi:MAG: hypothetical protein WC436_00955 [Candidatus Babeliales bacterium]